MTDTQTAWLLTIAGGGVVGGLYFASLWWTVQRAARTSHPVLFIAGSFLVRGMLAAALLVGFAGGDPWRLLGAVGAFLVVRTLAVRLARVTAPSTPAHRRSPEKG
jgi:F1F0 ATPase subunit 2